MKIGIFDPYLDSLSGGERYMLTMAACLAKDNEVTVFWEESSVLKKAEEKLGINLGKVTAGKNILLFPFLEKIKKTLEFDTVIVLSDGSIPFMFSDLYIHFQHPMEQVRLSFADFFKIKKAKRVICNSYFTKKYIDKKFHVNSVVLYPPVGIDQYKPEKKENSIVTVGRFSILPDGSDFKKQSVLIEEFEKLRKVYPEIKLTVVTGAIETEEKELAQFVESHKKDNVEFLISPKFSEFKKVYSKAKIYWHAAGFEEDISSYPERAEHFGITTVEAMSAGAVPVVFNGGGQKEIVRENINGMLWNSREELLEKTKKLLEDDGFYHNLSVQAIADSKKYGEESFCKNLDEIIRKK